MDKLIALRTVAAMLNNASAEKLKEYSENPYLNFKHNTLSALSSFYNKSLNRIPTTEEIILFDGFSKYINQNANLIAPSSLIIKDEYIAETHKDMMEKYAQIYSDYTVPCSVECAFAMANNVCKELYNRKFKNSDCELYAGKDNQSARMEAITEGDAPIYSSGKFCVAKKGYRKFREFKRLNYKKKYSATIIYTCDEQKAQLLENFAHTLSNNKKLNAFIADEGKFIFTRIVEYARKATVNSDTLVSLYDEQDDIQSHLPSDEEFRENGYYAPTESEKIFLKCRNVLFTDKVFGGYALSAIGNPKIIKKISEKARKIGLSVCNAIDIQGQRKLEFTSGEKVILSINTDVFRAIETYDMINIVLQKSDITKELPNVDFCKEYVSENEVLYKTKISVSEFENPYSLSVKAIILPFIYAGFDGFNAQNSDFDLAISAMLPFDDYKSYGTSYSYILGIYRALTEISVSYENSCISICKESGFIETALKVANYKPAFNLTSDFNAEEFYKNIEDENHLPHFETIRNFLNGAQNN